MWATLCSWTCCFNALSEMWTHPRQGTRSQANSSNRSFPSSTGAEESCRGCGGRFENSSSKHVCSDCQNNFCLGCSLQRKNRTRLCSVCNRVRTTNFQQEKLMKMSVRDLREYLERRGISTERCLQKYDLVVLIVGQRPPASQVNRTTPTTPFTVGTTAPQPDLGVGPQARLPVPTSTDVLAPTDLAAPENTSEGHQQANGHVPTSQNNMVEVENATDAQNAEQTQQANRHVSLSQNNMAEDENAMDAQNEEQTQQANRQVSLSQNNMTEDENAMDAQNEEQTQQANGHVPPSQNNMAEDEITTDAQNEEQTQQTVNMKVLGRRISLSDLTSVQDIDSLSVRQLKEILAHNFVNYKGCCEKWELMQRVTRLYEEKEFIQKLATDMHDRMASSSDATPRGSEENLCKVCMDAVIDCVLLECGHMVTCSKCGKWLNQCPICRQYVVRAVHVFRT